MLSRRIIACLDVRDDQVVKGVRFRGHEVVGGIEELSQRYRDEGIDELVFYDITASSERRVVSVEWVSKVARLIDIPFCVAGGIRSCDDARRILNAGADKVSVNSPALERPELISELAREFGSQCVVVGVDSRRESDDFRVYSYTGSEATTQRTSRSAMDWLREVEDRGAGEVVLNCMDSDGVGRGYDVPQLAEARKRLTIPLVASGGARTAEDFARVFLEADVDAALAAGAFHRGELRVGDLKHKLSEQGIEVRL